MFSDLLAALALMGPVSAHRTTDAQLRAQRADDGVCVTICNHWSYTGIGWQLGVESDVLSLMDAMGLNDRAGLKTCLEMDPRAYEKIAEGFPEVVKRLKGYLATGRVELVGGAYGQPMGTMFSGESNIRQIVVGLDAIQKVFGYRPSTFLEEEEFSHPQLPQILAASGYRYASLNQLDTWGRAGVPVMQTNSFVWEGKDGTRLPSTPENALFRAPLYPQSELQNWSRTSASPEYRKLKSQGKPMFVGWEEFGWEMPETAAYMTDANAYRDLAAKAPVEYVTLTEYMDKYGRTPKNTAALRMDDWNKSLTWGLGGDQLRIYNTKVENTLLAAERFDAVEASMGGKTQAVALSAAWKDLLASQSHDVGLCEYSRWQQDRMAPLDRLEDHHNFTWGALGYNLLDSAHRSGQAVLDASLRNIVARIGSGASRANRMICTIFNPCGWTRTDTARSGRIYPVPPGSRGVVVRDRAGRFVPSQLEEVQSDAVGNLIAANVAFVAKDVPSVGYDTYTLDFVAQPPPTVTDLTANESAMTMENVNLRVQIDPNTGAVSGLFDNRTGKEALKPGGAEFPAFKGKPNAKYPLRGGIPAEYDSSRSKPSVSWFERGPIRNVVKSTYRWSGLLYETYVALESGSHYVEVTTRVLSEVPPLPDADPKEIKEGYWLSFSPAFHPESVVRDYPLAVEATSKSQFHARTFVDLVGPDRGLLDLHPGTQFFRFEANGSLSNLVMREWESTYSSEYGWPRYAEYRHALEPHGPNFTNASRTQAATDFSDPLIAVVGKPHGGSLPARSSFLSVSPSGAQLSEFRKKVGPGYEIRLVDVEGRLQRATVALGFSPASVVATDLLGKRMRAISHAGKTLKVDVGPWKFSTLNIDR